VLHLQSFHPEASATSSSEDIPAPHDSPEFLNLVASLTVIKGHAQLIRRRARGMVGSRADALEPSLAAIEGAVHRVIAMLADASTTESGAEPSRTPGGNR
jgi:hypothetical protein